MAFDCTYLTKTLAQMQFGGARGMVGGLFYPNDEENMSFLSLDGDIQFDKVNKAATMLDCLVWDPCAKRKHPLSVLALPVQHSFGGAGATNRACHYMLEIVGRMMAASGGIVRALVFDAHGSHQFIRRALHGQFIPMLEEDLRQVPFFSELCYEDVDHGLPRWPIRLAKWRNEFVWCFPGICTLVPMIMENQGSWLVNDSSPFVFNDKEPLPFYSARSWIQHFVGAYLEPK